MKGLLLLILLLETKTASIFNKVFPKSEWPSCPLRTNISTAVVGLYPWQKQSKILRHEFTHHQYLSLSLFCIKILRSFDRFIAINLLLETKTTLNKVFPKSEGPMSAVVVLPYSWQKQN